MPKDTILFTLGHHTRNLISKEDEQRQHGLTTSYSGQMWIHILRLTDNRVQWRRAIHGIGWM